MEAQTLAKARPDASSGCVLVFGSFDLLHKGHRYFLRHSRQPGRRLVAVLARDEEIYRFKQRQPAWNYEKRKSALLRSGLVDEVISSDERHGTFYVLQRQDCPVAQVTLGDGQEALKMALEEFFCRREGLRCPIHFVAPHKRNWLSSTRLHQWHQAAAYFCLLLAMLSGSSVWVIGRFVASSGLAAPLAATLRLSMLAILFFIWQIALSIRQAVTDKKNSIWQQLNANLKLDIANLWQPLYSGLGFAVYNLCFFFGLEAIFASQGGVLTSVLIVLFSSVIYSVSHKAKLQQAQVLGLFFGILSSLVLMGGATYLQGLLAYGPHPTPHWQISLFIGTALSWSLISHLSSQVPKSDSLQRYSFYTHLFGALWTSWGWLWYEGGVHWLSIMGLVFVGSILFTPLYLLSLRFLRPCHVAGFLLLNPVFILVMSWLFLAEPWTWDLNLGTALAVLAIVLLNRSPTCKS